MRSLAARRTLIVLAALFVSGAHAANVGTTGQLQERAIKKAAWRNEPVKIVKLKVKGNPVEIGKKFLGEDDWLKGFSVTLKNTSDKTIVWLDIALNFPRPDGPNAEPDSRDHLVYGTYPPAPGADAASNPQQPPVKPGDTVDLALTDYEGTLDFLKKTNYHASIKQVEIDISEVIFDDGVMWSGGGLFRRDPNNPDGWKRIDVPRGNAATRRGRRYGSASMNHAAAPSARFDNGATPRHLKAAFTGTHSGSQIGTTGQCYGGCGVRYYAEDRYCQTSSGVTTRCAVRFDYVGCDFPSDPRETGVKIQYDRCVNRDTRVACNLYKWTDVMRPCPAEIAGDGNCTTPGFDGSCPEGTYPDGGGLCCADGSCAGGGLSVAPPPPGDAPAESPLPNLPPDPGPCRCDPSEAQSCYSGGGEWSYSSCTCVSPVVVDVDGDGFRLTDGAGGVLFDITADGVPERVSWTAAGSDDAWLALDRNGNGSVDGGAELFGNFTPQPAPPPGAARNGFLALAVYDRVGNGGNADGVIDARDAVFNGLRLWRDANHDGLSQPPELHTLPALDVVRLRLDYKESKRADEHGNRFLYRAKLDDARGAKVNRWAWDVFLVRGR